MALIMMLVLLLVLLWWCHYCCLFLLLMVACVVDGVCLGCFGSLYWLMMSHRCHWLLSGGGDGAGLSGGVGVLLILVWCCRLLLMLSLFVLKTSGLLAAIAPATLDKIRGRLTTQQLDGNTNSQKNNRQNKNNNTNHHHHHHHQ